MSGTPTESVSDPASTFDQRITIPAQAWRRAVYYILIGGSSLLGGWMMYTILKPSGITPLEMVLLVLFLLTFSWIVASFWAAVIGFLLQLFQRDPYSLKKYSAPQNRNASGISAITGAALQHRTAVVMPVYNEDTARVIAGFESNIRSLQNTGHFSSFDFFLLSDTQNPALATAELVAWNHMCERLGDMAKHCFYRRREKNTARKVGNLSDFCQRWGSDYQHMIVLDADSLMTGHCMVTLAQRMEANPQAGLIQTVPIPVRQSTFFGRFLQFGAELYCPMLASGLAFWQGNNCNYWGHNAIIRVQAFIDCCGLPALRGREPFGGDILSHDFVEAALLYRGGWGVYLATDLNGSYEEVPSNVVDYATRDRRWVQGNMQHLALLTSPGMSFISRLHFLFGALAYTSSLFLLSMLVFSTIDAVLRATHQEVYFQHAYQLFPSWPTTEPGVIASLLVITVVLLFVPKLMGLVVGLLHRSQEFGGRLRLIASTLLEALFAIVLAPMMMVFHAVFVVSVLLGASVRWDAQPRDGRSLSWREAWTRTCRMVLIALVWVGVTAYFTPLFFLWMSPILLGLLMSTALIQISSRTDLGLWCRRHRLLNTASELQPAVLLSTTANLLSSLPSKFSGDAIVPQLPLERWQPMSEQVLQRSRAQHSTAVRGAQRSGRFSSPALNNIQATQPQPQNKAADVD